MTTPQLRKAKLQLRLGFDPTNNNANNPSHLPNTSSPSFPAPAATPVPSLPDLTYESYKAANLDVTQQHDLIGQIRREIPLVERDEIDSMVLADAAKQLELCVFPMCKMMHIDAKAVKRMLDEAFGKAFGKAYGLGVLEEIREEENKQRTMDAEKANTMNMDGADIVTVASASIREPSVVGDHASGVKIMASVERTIKKVKRAQLSAVQKEISAYPAKKKRGKRACLVVTLRAKAAADKWLELTTEEMDL
jgi:hypothetical protein